MKPFKNSVSHNYVLFTILTPKSLPSGFTTMITRTIDVVTAIAGGVTSVSTIPSKESV